MILGALAFSGCAHFPVNAPLATMDASTEYRFGQASSPTNSEELLLLLAFSGGGTRAAAVACGVLEELAHTEVGPPGERYPLLAEVDAISSVSGGSFTAACYALWGDRFFTDFEPKFLKKSIQSALLCRTLTPRGAIRLASSTFSVSDLAAEYYDHILFKGATFGDLAARPGRPFLFINATDLTPGEPFEFTQDQFDLIGSDLSQFPLSRAVAASAAFPVLLSPITLKNYSSTCSRPEPEWIRSALADPGTSVRKKNRALAARSYCMDGERRRFIHLLDGGIADNLGLRSLVEGVIERRSPDPVPRALDRQKIRRVAVIIVDAEVGAELGAESKEQAPPIQEQLGRVMHTMLRRYSLETVELFKESARRLTRRNESLPQETRPDEGSAQPGDAPPVVSLYTVELHFGRLAEESDRQFFNSVPTRLQLPSKMVDRLRQMARKALARNEEFRRLVSDLDASRASEP